MKFSIYSVICIVYHSVLTPDITKTHLDHLVYVNSNRIDTGKTSQGK